MAGVNEIATRGYGLGGTRYIPTRGFLGVIPPPPTPGLGMMRLIPDPWGLTTLLTVLLCLIPR